MSELITFVEPKRKRCYVVFEPERDGGWWSSFVSKEWGHVYLLIEQDNLTLRVNSSPSSTDLELWDCEIDHAVVAVASADYTAILEYTPEHTEEYRFRFIHSCVSMIKALLNLRGFAVTPKQLYTLLKKNGAKEYGERTGIKTQG